MFDDIQVEIYRAPGWDSLSIIMYRRDPIKHNMIILHVTEDRKWRWDELEENGIIEPTIEISGIMGTDFMQKLSDALAQQGVMPTKVKDSETVLNVTKYHLEDMRRLVFKHVPDHQD